MAGAQSIFLAERIPVQLNYKPSAHTQLRYEGSVYITENDIGSVANLQEYERYQLHNKLYKLRKLQCNISMEVDGPQKQFHGFFGIASHDTGRYDTGTRTKFEVSFPQRPAILDKLEEVRGKSIIAQAKLFDIQKTDHYGMPLREDLATIETNRMQLPSQRGHTTTLIDDTYNSSIENLLQGRAAVFNGKLDLLLFAETSVPILRTPTDEDKMAFNRRILDEELSPDAVILPSNGIELKCHRSFLAVHSDVFHTMFTTDMKEAKTRRIAMPDMSEAGARAFLAYLYHWDETKAHESSAVAVELLKAGHKYNIRFLEHAMRNLLLSKPESWYNVDVAMKLFLFVRNFDAEWEPFKKKAVMVLKKKTPDLKNSPTVKELFRDNPEAAMDFCQYAIAI